MSFDIPGLTGTPMSDEEAAAMDQVVEIAMNSRSERWTVAIRPGSSDNSNV